MHLDINNFKAKPNALFYLFIYFCFLAKKQVDLLDKERPGYNSLFGDPIA